ncbi:ABC transporter substrate-binding protein [uncultured Aeromicrobium sp.]|uniref:ABC transporter substrate-binding protein n=1 Tax=uncultured Aeromicrobium sp. TaxID=337820 RepID=UPI0025F2C0CE|nr:ABC transporter substrate-binding protein [uncultured Aeromicrobium sp.]
MESTSRRRPGLIAAAGILALVLSACSSASNDADDQGFDPLTVQLAWIKNSEYAGYFFAEVNGYFEEVGFPAVTMVPGPSATESVVLSGQALVGVSSPVGVAPVIQEEGAPLKIIASVYQKSPFSIISKTEGADIRTPEDLVGTTIGVQSGGNENLFRALLEINGIDPASVNTVPVEYDPSPLITDEVDGFFAYITNEATAVELAGYPVSSLLFADHGVPFVGHSVIATEESIAERRDELKAYLEALILGWKDALADPEESARLAVEEFGADLGLSLEQETLAAEVQNTQLIVSEHTEEHGLFTMSEELIAENVELLERAGYALTADDIFDLSVLEELYAEKPELR